MQKAELEKEVLRLHFREQLSAEEIAERLELPPERVKEVLEG
jgi:DNA-directed RNA polymerase specialized sigma24 family protein